jgi:threonine/homoserine/homoserine lactone efflux protein
MTETNITAFLSLILFSLLPLGIGAAISPWPTTVTIMFLSTGRPLAKALAYLIGYSAVLVAIGIFALTVFGGGDYEGGDRSSAVGGTLDEVFGILFLVLALKLWLKAPDPSAPPPRWMSAFESINIGGAFLLGVFMMVTNFSTLPLYIAGLKELVTANLNPAGNLFALVLFILLIVVELLVPTVVYARSPRRGGELLDGARQWLEKYNRVISICIFVFYGILLLA